jgi:hypothetical protein
MADCTCSAAALPRGFRFRQRKGYWNRRGGGMQRYQRLREEDFRKLVKILTIPPLLSHTKHHTEHSVHPVENRLQKLSEFNITFIDILQLAD